MNKKAEMKILTGFLKIMDDPEKAEHRFKRYTQVAFAIFFVVILLFFSDNFEVGILPVVLGIGAGLALGLGFWFLQASTQTGLMVQHISRESIVDRLNEIDGS